ncbi:hypothetical protein TNCV_4977261 [Trichonephila clavipes]|nr:hypothetical protein TNCV_4977261 [Trichonephila clavipes]
MSSAIRPDAKDTKRRFNTLTTPQYTPMNYLSPINFQNYSESLTLTVIKHGSYLRASQFRTNAAFQRNHITLPAPYQWPRIVEVSWLNDLLH